jgi:TRAP-type C4-dicarboxylate transport system substrate-binding protein
MLKAILHSAIASTCALAVLTSSVPGAGAEPIVLKLSFFTSDRELAFQGVIKPFLDAVNAEGNDIVRIDAYTSGTIGQNFAQQVEVVVQQTADIAFINPALTPARFPEQAVMQLPGVFSSAREATLVYNRLIQRGAFRDLSPFVVIGAVANYPLIIHARPAVTSLSDLKGKRLRASNMIEALTLKSFGAIPSPTPINEITDAISHGTLDGATVPPGPLFEFGVARLASYHYLLPLGAAPLLVLMNKTSFDSLPAQAQDVIRRFSGIWLAERYLELYEMHAESVLEQLKHNPRRIVTEPTEADTAKARQVFAAVRADWQSTSSRNQQLGVLLEAAVEDVRAGRHENATDVKPTH